VYVASFTFLFKSDYIEVIIMCVFIVSIYKIIPMMFIIGKPTKILEAKVEYLKINI